MIYLFVLEKVKEWTQVNKFYYGWNVTYYWFMWRWSHTL